MQNHPFIDDESFLQREALREDPRAWSGSFSSGVVASAHYLASSAGAEMFARGGNAIDAAVATSFALGVCESAGSGIGGMSIMTIHVAAQNRTFVVEGACRAPRSSTPEAVAKSHRYRGFRAVAVPMNVAVLRHVLLKYGTLKEAEVLEPAIRLAEKGFLISRLQARNFEQYFDALERRSGGLFFLDSSGRPYPAGSRFKQPVLAKTLHQLAEAGLEDFYNGEIAGQIAQDMKTNGGFVDELDLAEALVPRELPPLRVRFDTGELFVPGPPAGGMSLAQLVRLDAEIGGIAPNTPRGVVRLARMIQASRQDRRKYRLKIGSLELGDAQILLSAEQTRRTAGRILSEEHGSDPGETSHISTMDVQGNAVGLTQSIERCFGSAEASPQLGFLYNGYLRGFKVENRNHPHFLRPGNVARSNAAPTIVVEDGRAQIVIGSTGSERMVSGIFEVLIRLRGSSPFEAVAAPRLHCTPEGTVLWEGDRFSKKEKSALERSGFVLKNLDSYSFKTGGLQLVVRGKDGRLTGVADPRRDGAALGT